MYLGDFAEDATVTFTFCTNAADGGRESFSATLEEADIVIFKGTTAMTLDASTITITTDTGSRTGVHTVSVDMSNDADFTTGSDYHAVLYASDETLDSQAPAGTLACWSCENRSVTVGTNNDKTGYSISGTKTTLDALNDLGQADVTGGAYALDTDANGRMRLVDGTGAGELALTSGFIDGITGTLNTFDDLNNLSTSDIDARLAAIGLDHLLSAAVVGADVADNSIFARLVSSEVTADWDDFNNTTDSLQALRDWVGNGSNLTEAGGAGDQLTAVPWNSSWDAEVQSEVNDALVALHLDHLIVGNGTVSNSLADATTSVFKTSLAAADGAFEDHTLVFVSGALAGQGQVIESYVQTNGVVTVAEPFTAAPSDGVEFVITPDHVHPISQIQDGLSTLDSSDVQSASAAALAAYNATATTDLPTNFGDLAITASTGRVTVGTNSDKTGYSISGTKTTLDALNDISQADVTGGAYALNTDTSGNVRIVDGTGANELSLTSGLIDGIAGTIQTLDALDTAQDTQHSTTQTAIGNLNNLSEAQVNAQVDAAIEEYHLDHLLAAAYDPTSKPGNASGLLNVLFENDGGVPRFTANALEQGPSGSGASAETIADAVLDELLSGHSTAGSLGQALTDLLTGVETDIPASITALPSQSDITGGAYALDTDANGRVRVVDGTGAGEIDTASGAVIAASLGTQAKADVNAELVDVMDTDTHAEIGQETPAATVTYGYMLGLMYKSIRNKRTQTSASYSLFNDDASTVGQTATVSDDGTTLTVGELTSGA